MSVKITSAHLRESDLNAEFRARATNDGLGATRSWLNEVGVA